MLSDVSPLEEQVLNAFPYQANDAVLHTDTRLMPTRRRAWASWNYHIPRGDERTADRPAEVRAPTDGGVVDEFAATRLKSRTIEDGNGAPVSRRVIRLEHAVDRLDRAAREDANPASLGGVAVPEPDPRSADVTRHHRVVFGPAP